MSNVKVRLCSTLDTDTDLAFCLGCVYFSVYFRSLYESLQIRTNEAVPLVVAAGSVANNSQDTTTGQEEGVLKTAELLER